MIRTVLVHLRGNRGDAATLNAALQIARPFAAHLECLHIRPDFSALIARAIRGDMDEDGDAIGKAIETMQRDSAASAQRAFDAFTELCDRERLPRSELPPGSDAMGASFREDIGDELDRLIAHSRRNDLVVVKGGGDTAGGLASNSIGRLILSAGRPVLVAPTITARPIRTVAVAWKDRAEAARAITAAMPLLENAQRVLVVTASEEDKPLSDANGVVHHLQWHGITAEAHRIEQHGRDACDAVLETAHAADADLVVAGAYGRSRLSELVFGGFTECLLEDASIPVLLLH